MALLVEDSTSWSFARSAGWDRPADLTSLVLMDLYDVFVSANSDPKKAAPKPHRGRPWDTQDKNTQKVGNTGGRSRDEVTDLLASARAGRL